MIDTSKEELLSMSQAAKACPKVDGKRPHSSSIWRWVKKGVKGVRLEHVCVGRRICTTREALARFMHELAQAPPPPCRYEVLQKPKTRTETQRDQAMARARRSLENRGVLKVVTEH